METWDYTTADVSYQYGERRSCRVMMARQLSVRETITPGPPPPKRAAVEPRFTTPLQPSFERRRERRGSPHESTAIASGMAVARGRTPAPQTSGGTTSKDATAALR